MKMLKNRKALSTVVTTLIILVVSVLLATVVTFYAINVTTTRVQEESLFLTKPHVWCPAMAGRNAQAALVIINTGGRDVVIDKISVRGQESDWSNVYYNITSGGISADLEYNSTLVNEGKIEIGGKEYIFKQGTSGKDITLKSGMTLIIYIDQPDSISLNDIGTTVGITVFTSNAQYYKETNVEAVEEEL